MPFKNSTPLNKIINTYLWFAYLPPKELPIWLDDCIKPENKGNSYTEEEVASKFDSLFDKLLNKKPNKKHVVPLSGGWDSRAILGALLKRLGTSQIETVTFGVPGQLDYDIGLKIANWAGVKYHAIDLRAINFSWEKIHGSVKKSPWTYTPDAFFNQFSFDLIKDDGKIIWSGFIGDVINGGHLSSVSLDPVTQRQVFINNEKRCKNYDLSNRGYDPKNSILIPKNNLKLQIEDTLLLGYHCSKCTAPINLPTTQWMGWTGIVENENTGYCFFTPFIEESWAGYWLSAPLKARVNQKLFFKLMKLKFPKLFSLPGKSNLGLPADDKIRYHLRKINTGVRKRIQKRVPWLQIKSNMHLNYVNYDLMFRKRKDYQETLVTAFDYLQFNGIVPWINLDKIWNEHMKRKKDHGVAFQVLLGLAANLMVESEIPK